MKVPDKFTKRTHPEFKTFKYQIHRFSQLDDSRFFISGHPAVFHAGDEFLNEEFDLIISVMERKPKINHKNHHFFKLDDLATEDISSHFDAIYKLTHGYKRILVHCRVGCSRSATALIAILMNVCIKRLDELTVKKFIKYLQRYRPIVDPNYGFVDQLEAYRRKLLKKKN